MAARRSPTTTEPASFSGTSKRERILRAAVEVFARSGYFNAKVTDIAKGAPLEMAHQGHLAEALLQQERRSDTGRGRLTRAPARQTEAKLRRGGLLAGEPPT